MKQILILLTVSALLFSTLASNRVTKHMLSITAAMNSAGLKERLNPNIRFYFAKQPQPEIVQSFGQFVSNKKTNVLVHLIKRLVHGSCSAHYFHFRLG